MYVLLNISYWQIFTIKHVFCDKPYSLWDDFQKRLKIESGRTPLIISFLGTKTKINILAKNLEGGTFVKILRKGQTGVKCSAITEYYFLYHCLTNITDIYNQVLMAK